MPVIITRGLGPGGSSAPTVPSAKQQHTNVDNHLGDFGQDISCFNDLDPSLSLVGGLSLLGQELLHRLITTRGSLSYDPDYGYDTRQLLNASITPHFAAQERTGIQAECLKNEKLQQCSVDLRFSGSTLTLTINGVTAFGPFTLVLGVDRLTAQILSFTPSP